MRKPAEHQHSALWSSDDRHNMTNSFSSVVLPPHGDIVPLQSLHSLNWASRYIITAIGKVDNTNIFIENYSRIPREIFVFLDYFLPLTTHSKLYYLNQALRRYSTLFAVISTVSFKYMLRWSIQLLWLPLEVGVVSLCYPGLHGT